MTAFATLRDTLADRRAARAGHRRLQRELAGYTTAAERLDLDAMLDRHSDDEGHEVRGIVASQRVSGLAGRPIFSGSSAA